MRRIWKVAPLAAAVGMVLPITAQAQTISGWADDIKSLHSVLEQLHTEMLPLCSGLVGVGRGIAGFAALWYIAARVWGHIARAESIDFYPLFKPFVVGWAVAFFPAVIALIGGVMAPTVTGTAQMVENSDAAIAVLLRQKEDAVRQTDAYQMYVGPTGEGDRDKWYQYAHPDEAPESEGWMESVGNDIRFAAAKFGYNFRNGIKEVIAEVLQLLFAAASLAINTMRTFNLIILAILGPLAFGLSIFDGFGHTLKHWLARYINVFLWLPIANLFGALIGKIQENMLKIDIGQVAETGDTFFSRTDMGYMIFLIIGILGYFSVPGIANQILWVGGGDSLTGRATGAVMGAAGMAATGGAMSAGMAAKAGTAGIDAIGGGMMKGGDIAGKALGVGNDYQRNKISGQ